MLEYMVITVQSSDASRLGVVSETRNLNHQAADIYSKEDKGKEGHCGTTECVRFDTLLRVNCELHNHCQDDSIRRYNHNSQIGCIRSTKI